MFSSLLRSEDSGSARARAKRRDRQRPWRRRSRTLTCERLEPRVLLSAGALDPTFGVGGKVITDFPMSSCDEPSWILDCVNTYTIGPTAYSPFLHEQVVVVQQDGNVLVAGCSFQTDTGRDFALARYNPDGSPDKTFGQDRDCDGIPDGKLTTDFGSEDTPRAITLDGDKILVAGTTGYVDGVSYERCYDFALARYNSNGTLDTTFGEDPDGDGVKTGKVITSFCGGDDEALTIAVDSQHRIVVAGFSDGQSYPLHYPQRFSYDFALARYNSNGTLDTSFGEDTDGDGVKTGKVTTHVSSYDDFVAAVAIDARDNIVVAGMSGVRLNITPGLRQDFALARYKGTDGSLDTTFGKDGMVITGFPGSSLGWNPQGSADWLAIDALENIVVAGVVVGRGGSAYALARYTNLGSLDTTFGEDLDGDGVEDGWMTLDSEGPREGHFAIDANNRIVVAGYLVQADTAVDFLARYNPDGSLDSNFGVGGMVITDFGGGDYVAGVALQSDGKIVAAGYSSQGVIPTTVTGDFALARYNADGTLDDGSTSDSTPEDCFGTNGKVITDIGRPGPDDAARDVVAVQPDGKILVAGYSNRGGTGYDFALARYNADGTLDTTFGQDRDGDGVRDGRLTTDFGGDDVANAIALQGDGKIVVAGGTSAVLLARYNADGTLDTTFDGDGKVIETFGFQGLYGGCSDVAIDAQGNILVSGHFTQSGVDLARFKADDGSLDTTFGNGGRVTIGVSRRAPFAIQDDGRIVVAFGNYYWTHYGGEQGYGCVLGLARFNIDGIPDTTFGNGGVVTFDPGARDLLLSGVAIDASQNIVVAGSENRHNYPLWVHAGFFLARFDSDGSLDTLFGEGGFVFTELGSHPDPWTVNDEPGNPPPEAMAIDATGRIVVAGSIFHSGSSYRNLWDFGLALYHADGSLVSTFGDSGTLRIDFDSNDRAYGVTFDAEGRIVVAGSSGGNFAVARYIVSLDVGPITAPVQPLKSGTTITASAPLMDVHASQTHTAVWDWGYCDPETGERATSAGTVTESVGLGSGTVTGTHTYTAAGDYPITLTVRAEDGDEGTMVFHNVAVYAGEPISFEVPDNYDVGDGYGSVAVADFNNDTIPDIVTANYSPDNVSVLLGNPDGTFQQPALDSPAGWGPYAIAVGYFYKDGENDGNCDVAVGAWDESVGSAIAILRGKGDGTFSDPEFYPVGGTPNSLAVGFIDGDQYLDLVAAYYDGVDVLLGNDDGSFQAPLPVATAGFSLALANLIDDENVDLVVADNKLNNYGYYTLPTVSVLRGIGDGSFQTPPSFTYEGTDWSTIPDWEHSVIVGDFSGDGKLDIVTVNSNNTLTVLVNDGAGSFHASGTFPVGAGPLNAVVKDFNRDGNLDLATANRDGHSVSVLLGKGDGSLERPLTFNLPANVEAEALAVGDFNRDGRPDLAVADGDKVWVLIQHQPVLTAPASQEASEGTPALFDLGTLSDPHDDGPWVVTVDWGNDSVSSFSVAAAGPLGTLEHTYPDSGTYTATVRVAEYNGGGPSNSADFQVIVGNLAPTAMITGPTSGLVGSSITLTGSATDPNPADQAAGFDYSWTITRSRDGGSTFVPYDTWNGETYNLLPLDGGLYCVTLTATGKRDGVPSQPFEHAIEVSNVMRDGVDLRIVGNSDDDTITIGYGGSPGVVEVAVNSPTSTSFSVAGRVLVFGSGGNDTITVSATGLSGLTINGQEGSDTYIVTLGNIAGPMTVEDTGTSGTDTLRVNCTWGPDAVIKTPPTENEPGRIKWGRIVDLEHPEATLMDVTIEYTPLEENPTIDLREADDYICDDGASAILGGPGNDMIVITGTLPGGVRVDGQDGSDSVVVACGALEGTVEVTDTGDVAQEVNTLTIQGTSGGNDFVVTKNEVTRTAQEVVESIAYSSITNLMVETGLGSNSVKIESSSSEVTIATQGGTDTCEVDLGNLAGRVTVANEATTGSVSVTINALGDNKLTLSGTQLTTDSGATIKLNLGSTLTNLAIDGSAGDNQLVVQGEPPAALTLENVIVATTTTLTSSANPSTLNGLVTFTATVSAAVSAAGMPDGAVQFVVDGSDWGDSVALSGGSASITTSALLAGPHTVTALYEGVPLFLPSPGNVVAQSVEYVFSGFLPPLSQNLAFALGRTIPIKFQLADASGRATTALSAVQSLQVASVASVKPDGTIGTPFNPAATGNTALRNDGGQYIFNWDTKGLCAGPYEILLKLKDGTTRTRMLQLSTTGGSARLTADSLGTGPTSATAGGLLGGDVALFVDSADGQFTPDEVARVEDAIAAANTVVAFFGVTIYQVDASNSALANVIVEIGTTSVVGGYVDGVLGCTAEGGEIMLIEGWNWFTSADTSLIGADQYDFQTIVSHELGHVLGLGHNATAGSVMYPMLASGVTRRALAVQDLQVANGDHGPSPLRVAVPEKAAIDAVLKQWSTKHEYAAQVKSLRSETTDKPGYHKPSGNTGVSTRSLLDAGALEPQTTVDPAAVVRDPKQIRLAERRYDRATEAVDGVFGSSQSGVDLLDLLLDGRLLPTSPKRHGRISAVDLALDEIVTMPFDDVLVNDLAMALA